MDGCAVPEIEVSCASAPRSADGFPADLPAALLRIEELEAEKEALRREVICERSRANSFSAQRKSASAKLAAERERSASLCRTAKDALGLRREVDRLTRLVDEMGLDARKRSTIVTLRKENGEQRRRIGDLEKELAAARRQCARRARALSAKDEAHAASLAKRDEEIEGLRRQIAVLSDAGDAGEMSSRIVKLEARLELLKAIQSNSNKRTFGKRSEKGARPRSGRKRGQRAGAAGHGRTPRPGLERRIELHEPAETACPSCGKAHARHGRHESEIIEIEVKAHKRVVSRTRHHAVCDCPRAGSEIVAPAPAVPEHAVRHLGVGDGAA